MRASRIFIIYTPRYDEQVGGALVLHYLAELLAEKRCEVRLWPVGKPLERGFHIWQTFKWYVKDWVRKAFFKQGFTFAPGRRIKLASQSELDDAVVVYPEVVDGNPLQARRVARWFLHKPGFHTGRIEYGSNELHFYYQKAFEFKCDGAESGGELFIARVFSDIYRNSNSPARKGQCYILRKGADRASLGDLVDGCVVDGLGHQEMAKVFNETEYCVSYDPYTFLSIYAAMCGCKSIVVPVDGLSKDQWQPVEELRYGLAYGKDDLEYARRTLPNLLALWSNKEAANKEAVTRFVRKCDDYFGEC